jgi:hypothetical protein
MCVKAEGGRLRHREKPRSVAWAPKKKKVVWDRPTRIGVGGMDHFLTAEQCTALELFLFILFFQLLIIKFSLNVVSFLIRRMTLNSKRLIRKHS